MKVMIKMPQGTRSRPGGARPKPKPKPRARPWVVKNFGLKAKA